MGGVPLNHSQSTKKIINEKQRMINNNTNKYFNNINSSKTSPQNSARKYFEDLKGTSEHLLNTIKNQLKPSASSRFNKVNSKFNQLNNDSYSQSNTEQEDNYNNVTTPLRNLTTNDSESQQLYQLNMTGNKQQQQQYMQNQVKQKLLKSKLKKKFADDANVNESSNQSDYSSSQVSTCYISEEQQRSLVYQLDCKQILKIEECLYYLSSTRNKIDMHKIYIYLLEYVNQFSAQNIQGISGMEKLVGGKESKKAVEKMIIYERLVMFIFLYEIIQNHSDLCDLESENQIQSEAYFKIGENLNNIYNALNYASQSNLLFMDYLGEQFEKEIELNHKKGDISDRLLERQKQKKLPKYDNKAERIQIISNFNDIILPILRLLSSSNKSYPYTEIKTLLEQINYSQINESTEKLNNIFKKYIEELKKLKEQREEIVIKLDESQISDLENNKANNKIQKIQEKQELKRPLSSSDLNQANLQDTQNFLNQLNQQQQQQKQQQQHLEQQQMVNVLNNADIQIPSEHVQEQLKQQQQQLKQEQQQQNQNDYQQQLQEKQVDQKQEKMSEQEEQENLKQQEEGIVGSARAPYLQPLKKEEEDQTYTLVLDLDETLVHYEELEEGGQFLVRPYAETFLEELGKKYELVIFTAALKDYADFILDIIDQKKQIKYKLYRQHTVPNGQSYVKDLSKLGRDLSKIIIIDNLAENFALQPANGIAILSWFGDADDKALYDLCPLLKQIVDRKFKDVRSALKQFRNQMMQRIMAGDENPQQNLDLDPNLE